MEDLKVFFTASGLLAAVLALWVRFWTERGLVGKAWCYGATLILVAGMGLAAGCSLSTQNGKAPDGAIGLFMAGLCMTAIAVAESGFHVALNCWQFVRGKGPDDRLLPEADLERSNPDDIKKNEWLRRLIVVCPTTCAGFLVLGFVLLSCGHFSSESSWFPLAASCFAVAVFAMVLVAGLVVGRKFFNSDS